MLALLALYALFIFSRVRAAVCLHSRNYCIITARTTRLAVHTLMCGMHLVLSTLAVSSSPQRHVIDRRRIFKSGNTVRPRCPPSSRLPQQAIPSARLVIACQTSEARKLLNEPSRTSQYTSPRCTTLDRLTKGAGSTSTRSAPRSSSRSRAR